MGKELRTDMTVPREKIRLVQKVKELPRSMRIRKYMSRRLNRNESFHDRLRRPLGEPLERSSTCVLM